MDTDTEIQDVTDVGTSEILKHIINDMNKGFQQRFFSLNIHVNKKAVFNYLIVATLFLVGGLTWAWIVDPVEWVAPPVVPVSINSFSTSTKEITALGIVTVDYATRNDKDKSLIDNTVRELGVDAETLCSIHRKFISFYDETLYAINRYEIICGQ